MHFIFRNRYLSWDVPCRSVTGQQPHSLGTEEAPGLAQFQLIHRITGENLFEQRAGSHLDSNVTLLGSTRHGAILG